MCCFHFKPVLKSSEVFTYDVYISSSFYISFRSL
jgi:hypothetical protein